jgi:DNA replication protein DnaC
VNVEPKPIAIDAKKILAALRTFRESEAGRVAAADYERSAERRRVDALLKACDMRNVPKEPGLREAIVNPARTQALKAVRGSLGWRDAKPIWRGARQPVVAVLAGRPGDGKSTALAWAVAHHERSAAFVLARVIGSTPRSGFSNIAQLERWASVDLLAIDELGHEDAAEAERIAALLSERYDHGHATLCATNLDLDTFLTRYVNARLESRIHRGQFRGGAPGSWPYFHIMPDIDLRDPANIARLVRARSRAQ